MGTALLHELRTTAKLPLRALGRFDQDGAQQFLRRHDFRLLNRC